MFKIIKTSKKLFSKQNMTKTEKILRGLMCVTCILTVVSLGIFSGYTCLKYHFNPPEQNISSKSGEAFLSPALNASQGKTLPETSQAYMARISQGKLSIFKITQTGEEFMYSLNVRLEDITAEELYRLTSGIYLKDNNALASFEEDFTG